LEKSVTKKLEPEKIKYFCPVDENVNITLDDVKNFKEMRWNTFDQFKRRASSVWIVSIQNDHKWQELKLTCPCFCICKYSISFENARLQLAAKDVHIN